MNKKILIFAPRYEENSGGAIALHKLCSIFNEQGYESYLHPAFASFLERIRPLIIGYDTNPNFFTPVLRNKKNIDWKEWVVIYPETAIGNPLRAKNVVRWLLHNPGFHRKKISYGKGELYFKYCSGIADFEVEGSYTSKILLKVIDYPLHLYNTNNVAKTRSGIAYSIRKGKGKKIQHKLTGSLLIDNKSHAEIADIFKKVKTFISYDTMSAYSVFAALCGCESVVIPDEGVSINQWYSNPQERYGISYGFSNIEEALSTQNLLKERILMEQKNSIKSALNAYEEIKNFFQ